MSVIAIKKEVYRMINLVKGMYMTLYPDKKVPSSNIIVSDSIKLYHDKLSLRMKKKSQGDNNDRDCGTDESNPKEFGYYSKSDGTIEQEQHEPENIEGTGMDSDRQYQGEYSEEYKQ